MDTAVALVQAYLQVNGYFTVAEVPILEALRHGGSRTATDLDLLAVRFPGASPGTAARGGRHTRSAVTANPDPHLGIPASALDMIVGEVKEGSARFNPAARDPRVLAAALVRFGCCPPESVADTVQDLLHRGAAQTPAGHTVRMIAFGSTGTDRRRRHKVITMGHIVEFLRAHLRHHWRELGRTHLSQPALAFLALLEKAERGLSSQDPDEGLT